MKQLNVPKVTRVEVIDETGRAYVRYNVIAEVHLQDDDRTLKVFIYPKPNEQDRV